MARKLADDADVSASWRKFRVVTVTTRMFALIGTTERIAA
jgi:hypothetical protein